MKDNAFKPATGQDYVLVKSETMLAKIEASAGMEVSGRLNTAIVKQDGQKKVFYYTHIGGAHPSKSDREAVETAMGPSADYWADTRLKVIRVKPEDVVFHGKTPPETIKTADLPLADAAHYNYVEANVLRPGHFGKTPSMEVRPKEEPKPRVA